MEKQVNDATMLNPGPFLQLLMLCERNSHRRHSPARKHSSLPRGCVLSVRYCSR